LSGATGSQTSPISRAWRAVRVPGGTPPIS
jgi:hypothetical protein